MALGWLEALGSPADVGPLAVRRMPGVVAWLGSVARDFFSSASTVPGARVLVGRSVVALDALGAVEPAAGDPLLDVEPASGWRLVADPVAAPGTEVMPAFSAEAASGEPTLCVVDVPALAAAPGPAPGPAPKPDPAPKLGAAATPDPPGPSGTPDPPDPPDPPGTPDPPSTPDPANPPKADPAPKPGAGAEPLSAFGR
ncbi:hypothetical protein [Actinoplanes sp. NPDC089786]|uniref:hypothetical protein n=1 Tax=Actinoplanes sp. NPDC089786 TaxID=3155185 RepID=UPI003415C14B